MQLSNYVLLCQSYIMLYINGTLPCVFGVKHLAASNLKYALYTYSLLLLLLLLPAMIITATLNNFKILISRF